MINENLNNTSMPSGPQEEALGGSPIPVIPYATPGGGITTGGIWRVGSKLVVPHESRLAPFCVKCNTPVAGEARKQTYYYYHPAILLLLLLNILIFAIVALASRKKGTVYIHVCPRHRKGRRIRMLWVCALLLGGIGAIVAGIVNNRLEGSVVGSVMIVAGVVVAYLNRELYATKIDGTAIWLKGAGPGFLAEFPTAPWTQ